MKKIMSAALTAAMLFVFFSTLTACGNIDPNINGDKPDPTSSATEAPTEAGRIPDYVDADSLARRSYELCFLLGQNGFNSPEEMSVNAVVQYAFCHLFYDDLTDMPTSGNKLRSASADEIEKKIAEYFGDVTIDVTQSDLYNAGLGIFEMWEPAYGTQIFYDAAVIRAGEHEYKVRTTFYTDVSKTEVKGKTVLTCVDDDGHVAISKMTSSR